MSVTFTIRSASGFTKLIVNTFPSMEAVGGAGTTERMSSSLHFPLTRIESQNAACAQKMLHNVKIRFVFTKSQN